MGARLDAHPLPSRSGGEVSRAKPETERGRFCCRSTLELLMPDLILHPGNATLADWRAIYRGATPKLDPACKPKVKASAEAVARILACGMGLTIQHTRMGRGRGVKLPLIIGHEIAAEIVEVGSGAHQTVNAADGRMTEALLDLTGGQGVDVVVDYVSTPKTLTAGIKVLGGGGRVVTIGGGRGGTP